MLSFMDGFSGYNQIKMAEQDQYVHPSMGHFLLQCNALRIEERRGNNSKGHAPLFHEMMHKEMEVDVDDLIAKSCGLDDHLANQSGKAVQETQKEVNMRKQSNEATGGGERIKGVGRLSYKCDTPLHLAPRRRRLPTSYCGDSLGIGRIRLYLIRIYLRFHPLLI